nr:immunoglobulin light chain junction region [Macaca mulatta]
CQQCNSLPLTF